MRSMTNGRITVLVDDTGSGYGLLVEHGLSFWIERGEKKILFDTGQSALLCENARRLGIQLDSTDGIVLSHGHYDHTGGLGAVLRSTGRVPVYGHPALFEPKFAKNSDGTARQIGMTSMNEAHIRDMAEWIRVERPTAIGAGMWLTGPIPRTTSFEDTGGDFFKDPDCTEPDSLEDDQAVFLETAAGTVVILGCAHAGVINTIRYIQKLTGTRPITTIIGGMHLLHADRERLDKTVKELRDLKIRQLLPCHCTGTAAKERFRHEFPEIYIACLAGTVLVVNE
jgi:7,8-dihydropterin-6-yl-methyl-4-(beta-D-ribofuranosyl)aminobenzene 5'-phosphate synthase